MRGRERHLGRWMAQSCGHSIQAFIQYLISLPRHHQIPVEHALVRLPHRRRWLITLRAPLGEQPDQVVEPIPPRLGLGDQVRREELREVHSGHPAHRGGVPIPPCPQINATAPGTTASSSSISTARPVK
jgi:hypothetical protein